MAQNDAGAQYHFAQYIEIAPCEMMTPDCISYSPSPVLFDRMFPELNRLHSEVYSGVGEKSYMGKARYFQVHKEHIQCQKIF